MALLSGLRCLLLTVMCVLLPVAAYADSQTTISLTVDNITTVGQDEPHQGPQDVNNETRLPFSITQGLPKKFYLYWIQTYPDYGAGRVTNAAGKYTYPEANRDVKSYFGIRNSAIRDVDISFGGLYRGRFCCPGVDDPTNKDPMFYHAIYGQVAYHFGPMGRLGRWFYTYFNYIHAKHDPTAYLLAHRSIFFGLPDTGGEPNYEGLIRATVPFDRRGDFIVGSESLNSDYYENAPFPTYYYTGIAGIGRKIDRYVLVQAYFLDTVYHKQGWPSYGLNAGHHSEVHVQSIFTFGGKS